ncbi:hypothetical protein MAR_000310 [Mya arenaria]|uniref:Uncharacterized protein n=1 Tax=Mya arenaria TaxID=6604 RepID=A0ABY7F8E0_MYAAR|nr:hypothetical protein MAR_000310 [Mya arenaria]
MDFNLTAVYTDQQRGGPEGACTGSRTGSARATVTETRASETDGRRAFSTTDDATEGRCSGMKRNKHVISRDARKTYKSSDFDLGDQSVTTFKSDRIHIM